MVFKRVLLLVTVGALLLALAIPALAQGDTELTETITDFNGRITINYPAEWTVQQPRIMPELVFLGTSEAALDLMTGAAGAVPMPPGEMAVGVYGPQALPMFLQAGVPTSLDEALAFSKANDMEGSQYGEPEELTIAGLPAMRMTVANANGDGGVIAIDLGGEFAIALVTAAPGEYADQEALVFAVLDTLSYEVAEGIIEYQSLDGSLRFDYPADWELMEMFPGNVSAVNDLALMASAGATSDLVVLPGVCMLVVNTPQSVFFTPEIRYGTLADGATNYLAPWAIIPGTVVMDPVYVTVGGYQGVRIDFTATSREGYVMAIDQDGERVIVSVSSAPGEMAACDEVILPILESLRYAPVEIWIIDGAAPTETPAP